MKPKRNTYQAPKWLLKQEGYISQRAWRWRKKCELESLMEAQDRFHLGCAFTPCAFENDQIGKLLETMKKKMNTRNWGR